MNKERNYTIEFFRFMFAVNFVLLHVFILGPVRMGGVGTFANGFDVIIPFMAFSGYFLMAHFKKLQAKGLTEQTPPSRQAWINLKARLIALLPLFIVVTIACVIATSMWYEIPALGCLMYMINAVPEIFGLQIGGFYGNAVLGTVAEKGISAVTTAGPLWFMSGIFVCGYAIYYLLARNERHFTGWIAPLTILLFYGSSYLTDNMPMWNKYLVVGDFAVASGLLHMFCGMSIGVLLWVACNNLEGKEWSRGMKVVLSLIQLFCMVVVFFKSWVSTSSPLGQMFNIGWGATFFYTTVFSFLCLLNVDAVTRCPIFSSKIWRVPGRMAMYVYMIHYPVMTFVLLAMGCHPNTWEQNADKITPAYFIVLAVSLVLSYIVMKFEEKVLRPWLKSRPWYTRAQAEKEIEA